MSGRNVYVLSGRIMRQLIRGKRFHFFFWVLPPALMLLTKLALTGSAEVLKAASMGERPLQLAGLLAQSSIFIGALVVVLKDRLEGTMDRMFISSFRPVEIFFGYLLGFMPVILIQAPLMLVVTWWLFGTPIWTIGPRFAAAMGLQLALMSYIGVGLAFVASMLAQNQSQVSSFLIGLFVPSMLVSGILFNVDHAHVFIRLLGYIIPVRYMVAATRPTLALTVYFVATVVIGSWVFRESQ